MSMTTSFHFRPILHALTPGNPHFVRLRQPSLKSGNTSRAATSGSASGDSEPQWTKFLATLFVTGAVSGPLLDGIHSRVHLQTYESLAVDIDAIDFHTSLWVPLLLGVFYAVLGTLQPYLDATFEGQESKQLTTPLSLGYIALCFGILAAGIELSAFMYESGCPYIQIHAALFVTSVLVWRALDNTKQGIVVAIISAVGGILAELPIQYFLGWWHYEKPDLFGLVVTWTFWCYFFYTPAVGNLGRKLWQECSLGDRK